MFSNSRKNEKFASFLLFLFSIGFLSLSINSSKTASFFTIAIALFIISTSIRSQFFQNYSRINIEIKGLKYQEPFLIILISLILFITQNVNLNIETIDWDIHSYLVASQEINKGNIPLETQWESKGPIFFYMYNFLSNISGGSFIIFKLLNDVLLLIISLILFNIIRIKSNNIVTSFFVTIFYILLMSITWGTLEYSELYSLLFIAISYYLFIKYPFSSKTLFLIGFSLSASTLVNQGSVLFLIPFLIVLLAREEDKKLLFKKYLVLGSGFSLLHTAFLFLYFSKDLLDIYLATFITIPLGYTSSTFNFFGELMVFFRSYFEFNIFLYISTISLITFIISGLIKSFFSVKEIFKIDLLNTMFIFSSLLFYFLGSHGFNHHLMFFLFFLPVFLEQIKIPAIKNIIFFTILISSINLVATSFGPSFYNLTNVNKIYNDYPLKNLASEIDSYFDSNFTVLALDYVLVLHYLEMTNFSYIVHPTNHYANFITDELTRLNKIEERNIDKLICYKRADCEEPDVIICSHRMIIDGEIVKNKLFNCMVSDYKNNYFSINTDNYRYDENLSYYFDPYKEIAVFIKKNNT